MPTYYAVRTEVGLYTWDPTDEENGDQSTPPRGTSLYPLIEEDFPEYPGLQDSCGYPFYVIKAGSDLYFKTQPEAKNPAKFTKRIEPIEENEDPKPTNRKYREGHIDQGSPAPSSSLTSLASSPAHTSNVVESCGSGNETKPNSSRRSRGWSFVNSKIPASTIERPPWIPIQRPVPIKVQVTFSRKSFINSGIEQIDPSQDVCVNIYFNGQFTHSKIFRAKSMRSSTANEKEPSFSGLRIDPKAEIPWVLLPLSHVEDQPEGCTSFTQRWDEVNSLIAKEAEIWGMEGKLKLSRTPMGGYLEALSKKPAPKVLNEEGTAGGGAGIIDVIVVLGRSETKLTSTGRLLREPRRKFPEDICGSNKEKYIVPELVRKKQEIMYESEDEEVVCTKSGSISARGKVKVPQTPMLSSKVQEGNVITPPNDWALPHLSEGSAAFAGVSSSSALSTPSSLALELQLSPGQQNRSGKSYRISERREQDKAGGMLPPQIDMASKTLGPDPETSPKNYFDKNQKRKRKQFGSTSTSTSDVLMLDSPTSGNGRPSKAKRTRLSLPAENDGLAKFLDTRSQPNPVLGSSKAFSIEDPLQDEDVKLEEEAKKTRKPARAVSSRELAGLLQPHTPVMPLNTSFGTHFVEASSYRQARGSSYRQTVAPSESTATAFSTPQPSQVKAEMITPKILRIKGLSSMKTLIQGISETQGQLDGAVDTGKNKPSKKANKTSLENKTPAQRKRKSSSSTTSSGISSARTMHSAKESVNSAKSNSHLVIETPTRPGIGEQKAEMMIGSLEKQEASIPTDLPVSILTVPSLPIPPLKKYNSLLTYADEFNTKDWTGVRIETKAGNVNENKNEGEKKVVMRDIRSEREGVFRGTSVLMGVRFVVGLGGGGQGEGVGD